ncbi:hypothetical protein KL948_003258 [Ogataea haglerorum]|nr:hypothetical protein KL948_003258 [Ogataea haglerorum]
MDSSSPAYDYCTRKHISHLVPKTGWGIIAITVAVSLIEPTTTGMESSIMGAINSLPQYKSYFDLKDHTIGLNSAAVWIGLCLTLPFVQQMCDGLGRRKTIFYSLALMVTGIVLSSCSVHIAMFVIGRIVLGMSSGIFGSAASVLVAEVCPPKHRGLILGLFHSGYYIGSLLSSAITYGTRDMANDWSWRVPLICQIVPTIICFTVILFAPESPRWLVMHGKEDEAREIFYILEGGDTARAESLIKVVHESVTKESIVAKGLGLWRRQFSTKANLRRAFILLNVGILCELGGSNIATYYFNILLSSVGVTNVRTQLEVSMIRSAWCLVCSLAGCYTFDIIGRKKQAFIATTGLIVCLYILGGLVKKFQEDGKTSTGYGAIALMFLFTGFYSYCYTPLLYLYAPELYTNPSRSVGNTILKACDYFSGLFATFVLPIGMSNLTWKFYMITASYDMIFLPFIAFTWVETKGVPLEKICELFDDDPGTLDWQEPQLESGVEYVTVDISDKKK